MKTTVQSRQLQFTRDGRMLVVAEADEIMLVELRGDGRRRIAVAGVQAVAAFAEQVWVVMRSGALVRFASDGRQIDEHALPIETEALLIPTTIGGSAALWTGCEPVMLIDDLGALAVVPTDVNDAIPIAGRRFAHYAGSRLTLPAGTTVTLVTGARITGGSVVLDGTSLALVAEHQRRRDIIVLALASGRIVQTLALPAGTVRIAARRGLAVVHDAARRLVVFDLRFARHLGAVVTDDAGSASGLPAIAMPRSRSRPRATSWAAAAAAPTPPRYAALRQDAHSTARRRHGCRRSGRRKRSAVAEIAQALLDGRVPQDATVAAVPRERRRA